MNPGRSPRRASRSRWRYAAAVAVTIAAGLGHLVLGQGFHAFDLACYAIGVALGATLEIGAARASRAVTTSRGP